MTKPIFLLLMILYLFAGMNYVNGQWAYNNSHIYNTNNGFVGIGTGAPATQLHVARNFTEPTITIQNLGGSGGATYSMIDNASGANWKFKATLDGGFKIRDHANSLDVIQIEPNSAANVIYIDADGEVGIGTNSVNAKLKISYSYSNATYLGYTNKYLNYINHSEDQANGDGQAGLFVMRSPTNVNHGTGYDIYSVNSAMTGSSWNGFEYSFGTIGFNYNEYTRCGGVLGAQEDADYWGSLGYKSSGDIIYGGYFTSTGSGSGKSYQDAFTGIGLGAWGDLFGADIHGEIYGAYIEGGNYALYTHGPVYKDNLDIHLQAKPDGSNAVLYTNVTSVATVQTCGTAVLSSGKANISFDPVFASVVSAKEPIIITVTPLGESKGVFLDKVSKEGFSVIENNAGKSNITVNYIAVGKRAGFENPPLASEVIDREYIGKLSDGLHDDADLQSNGQGVYFENGKLISGPPPSQVPVPARKFSPPDMQDEKPD